SFFSETKSSESRMNSPHVEPAGTAVAGTTMVQEEPPIVSLITSTYQSGTEGDSAAHMKQYDTTSPHQHAGSAQQLQGQQRPTSSAANSPVPLYATSYNDNIFISTP
ncbi:unnamed protein product, partial [Amoebophrya sp. A120]